MTLPGKEQLLELRRVLFRHGVICGHWQCPLMPQGLGRIEGLDRDQIDILLSLFARLG